MRERSLSGLNAVGRAVATALMVMLHSVSVYAGTLSTVLNDVYHVGPNKEVQLLNCDKDKSKECDELEFKLRVFAEHYYPQARTSSEFYSTYPLPPKACNQFASKVRRGRADAAWTCAFWSVREAAKYALAGIYSEKPCSGKVNYSEIEVRWRDAWKSCEGEIQQRLDCFKEKLISAGDPKEYKHRVTELVTNLKMLNLFSSACNERLRKKSDLKSISEVCRSDEAVKFLDTVLNHEQLKASMHLFEVYQPGFEPENAPDYVYLLNECDVDRIKRNPKYGAPPAPPQPKNACVDEEGNRVCTQAIPLSAQMDEILGQVEKGGEKESGEEKSKHEKILDTLKKVLEEEKNKPGLSDKNKALLNQMLKDKKYLEKTASYYEKQSSNKKDENQIEKAGEQFRKEIIRTEQVSDGIASDSDAGADVELVEEKQKIANQKTDTEKNIEEKIEEEKKAAEQKHLQEIAKQIAAPASEEEKKQLDQAIAARAPDLRTTQQLAVAGEDALKKYKETGELDLDVGRYLLESEFVLSKNDNYDQWNQAYQKQKALEKQVQQSIDNESRGSDWQVYELAKISHQNFLKNYAAKFALILDCFLGNGCNCEGETKTLYGLMNASKIKLEEGQVLAAQKFTDHIQLVVWDKNKNQVKDILSGRIQNGIVAPLYDPASFVERAIRALGGNSPIQPKEFLLAKKNIYDPKNKGEPAGPTNTVLSSSKYESDVSFGQGAPNPEHALKRNPLNPDQAEKLAGKKVGSEDLYKESDDKKENLKNGDGSIFITDKNGNLYNKINLKAKFESNQKYINRNFQQRYLIELGEGEIRFFNKNDFKYYKNLNPTERLSFLVELEKINAANFLASKIVQNYQKSIQEPLFFKSLSESERSNLYAIKNHIYFSYGKFSGASLIPMFGEESGSKLVNKFLELRVDGKLLVKNQKEWIKKLSENPKSFIEFASSLNPSDSSRYFDFIFGTVTLDEVSTFKVSKVFSDFILDQNKLNFKITPKGTSLSIQEELSDKKKIDAQKSQKLVHLKARDEKKSEFDLNPDLTEQELSHFQKEVLQPQVDAKLEQEKSKKQAEVKKSAISGKNRERSFEANHAELELDLAHYMSMLFWTGRSGKYVDKIEKIINEEKFIEELKFQVSSLSEKDRYELISESLYLLKVVYRFEFDRLGIKKENSNEVSLSSPTSYSAFTNPERPLRGLKLLKILNDKSPELAKIFFEVNKEYSVNEYSKKIDFEIKRLTELSAQKNASQK